MRSTVVCTVARTSTVSQGTATNGCCCTVIVAEILSSSSAESHLALATQIPTSTEYCKTPIQKLQLFRYASPQNPQLCNSTLATFNICNYSEVACHVSTISLHVACIMIAKCYHVATVVADPPSQVGAASALRLHCPDQCNEDSNAHSTTFLFLQKQTCKIQSNLD